MRGLCAVCCVLFPADCIVAGVAEFSPPFSTQCSIHTVMANTVMATSEDVERVGVEREKEHEMSLE